MSRPKNGLAVGFNFLTVIIDSLLLSKKKHLPQG